MPSPSRSHRPHQLARLAGALAALSLVGPARAAEHCRVELVGYESAAWRQAAAELEAELELATWSRDCSAVLVEVEDGRAVLTFTTTDGRSAGRELEHPVELVPTVQALSATPPEQAIPERAIEPARASASATPERDAGATALETENVASSELAPVWGAHAGFRGGADRLISPVLGVTAAVLLERWELGLLGRYEAHYVDTRGGNEERPESSGVALGLTVGRRAPAGALALRGAAGMLITALHEEKGDKEGRAELRGGAYAGFVWPERAKLALRLDLGFEVVPYNVGRSETNASGSSSLPWWAATFAVGPEFR